jgi:hypothetical protein
MKNQLEYLLSKLEKWNTLNIQLSHSISNIFNLFRR